MLRGKIKGFGSQKENLCENTPSKRIARKNEKANLSFYYIYLVVIG